MVPAQTVTLDSFKIIMFSSSDVHPIVGEMMKAYKYKAPEYNKGLLGMFERDFWEIHRLQTTKLEGVEVPLKNIVSGKDIIWFDRNKILNITSAMRRQVSFDRDHNSEVSFHSLQMFLSMKMKELQNLMISVDDEDNKIIKLVYDVCNGMLNYLYLQVSKHWKISLSLVTFIDNLAKYVLKDLKYNLYYKGLVHLIQEKVFSELPHAQMHFSQTTGEDRIYKNRLVWYLHSIIEAIELIVASGVKDKVAILYEKLLLVIYRNLITILYNRNALVESVNHSYFFFSQFIDGYVRMDMLTGDMVAPQTYKSFLSVYEEHRYDLFTTMKKYNDVFFSDDESLFYCNLIQMRKNGYFITPLPPVVEENISIYNNDNTASDVIVIDDDMMELDNDNISSKKRDRDNVIIIDEESSQLPPPIKVRVVMPTASAPVDHRDGFVLLTHNLTPICKTAENIYNLHSCNKNCIELDAAKSLALGRSVYRPVPFSNVHNELAAFYATKSLLKELKKTKTDQQIQMYDAPPRVLVNQLPFDIMTSVYRIQYMNPKVPGTLSSVAKLDDIVGMIGSNVYPLSSKRSQFGLPMPLYKEEVVYPDGIILPVSAAHIMLGKKNFKIRLEFGFPKGYENIVVELMVFREWGVTPARASSCFIKLMRRLAELYCKNNILANDPNCFYIAFIQRITCKQLQAVWNGAVRGKSMENIDWIVAKRRIVINHLMAE